MPIRVLLLSLALTLFLAAPAAARIVPGTGMAGVRLGDCQAEAVAKLGPPDRTSGRRDFAGFVSTYTYVSRGLKLEFRRGPEPCLEMTSIFTSRGLERTREGIGKGSQRRTLRARLRGERCRTFRRPRTIRTCTIGTLTPGRPVTEFRIDSKLRVSWVRVAILID